jgi:hypothetical protein
VPPSPFTFTLARLGQRRRLCFFRARAIRAASANSFTSLIRLFLLCLVRVMLGCWDDFLTVACRKPCRGRRGRAPISLGVAEGLPVPPVRGTGHSGSKLLDSPEGIHVRLARGGGGSSFWAHLHRLPYEGAMCTGACGRGSYPSVE